MIYIGIDTGTHTGFAVWDSHKKTFKEVRTMQIHQAMQRVEYWSLVAEETGTHLHITIEDARQRKWYTGDASAKAQGAGSVKRDASVWEAFLKDRGYNFTMVPPRKGMTKMNDAYFARLTGWTHRTSEHSRDAALLVFAK